MWAFHTDYLFTELLENKLYRDIYYIVIEDFGLMAKP